MKFNRDRKINMKFNPDYEITKNLIHNLKIT